MHKIKKPTLIQIKQIHHMILKAQSQKYIGLSSSKEYMITSVLDGVEQTFSGTSLYPTICDKASYILRGIESSQAFPDGNKRVALATFEMFLSMNGSNVNRVSQKRKELFVLGIANKLISKDKTIECCIKAIRKSKIIK